MIILFMIVIKLLRKIQIIFIIIIMSTWSAGGGGKSRRVLGGWTRRAAGKTYIEYLFVIFSMNSKLLLLLHQPGYTLRPIQGLILIVIQFIFHTWWWGRVGGAGGLLTCKTKFSPSWRRGPGILYLDLYQRGGVLKHQTMSQIYHTSFGLVTGTSAIYGDL